ncbi:MAG TPA: hypothetical protein VMP08_12625 [Anaerolineae bacterium]|nr:hypothetical protein [Anaerolineae bacterium]
MAKFARVIIWVAVALTLLFPVPLSAGAKSAVQPLAATNILYDGTLNTGTPDTQGFFYLTYPLTGTQVTQVFSSPVTILDSTSRISDYAGYFAKPIGYAPLDRVGGYQILFTTQIVTETHISPDRAGFSLLVESSDERGIELGFWSNEVWAQEGGSSNPFTHAESAAFTTTVDLVEYRLSVMGNNYTLAANGSTVLSGPLRDYTIAPAPPLPINPYTTPNLIFLGDDTSSAQARIKLRYAAVINAPPFKMYLPLMSKNSTSARRA